MGALTDIRVYLTQAHACGYWPDRLARDLVLDPQDPALGAVYESALALGFRRSGRHVYRPHCPTCSACLPIRLPVARFRADRSQRRTLAANKDLAMTVGPARRSDEHFALYARYLSSRHPDSPMADPAPAEFEQFLVGDWSPTRFFEFRMDGRLVAVAVTDVTPNALSAVYTFFDPDFQRRGLGTHAILSQIAWAQETARPHLYLGFWLKGHPKMDYKRRFRPLERLWNGHWIAFDEASE
ncbi:MAG: arginyltransferase [Lysobacteraceae bacterium]|jgi:arginyl-tRNA--protein-N-Asp/Glu arginylyltransferase|nr:arginyltransferase [Xanthomonadaceae bacterium]MCZ8317697.1 arginyltransferase [Silanimonas sp.]